MNYEAIPITSRSLSPEQTLFQQVIVCALLDAIRESPGRTTLEQLDKYGADRWIRSNCRDFRLICSLAGIDPEFLRRNYLKGNIDRSVLIAAGSIGRKASGDEH